MYDIHMHLNSFHTITCDGSKNIATKFNINTRKTIHIVCVYKVHLCLIFTFLNNLRIIIQHSPKHCPIINMGDFNVEIKNNNNQKKKKNYYISWINFN